MKPFFLNHIQIIPDQNEIHSFGKVHQLQSKIMAVLIYLKTRQGEVVSKNELIEMVWQQRIVADEVLTNAIWVLRNALGDSAKNSIYIKTVPRKGYVLLVEPIESIDSVESLERLDNKNQITDFNTENTTSNPFVKKTVIENVSNPLIQNNIINNSHQNKQTNSPPKRWSIRIIIGMVIFGFILYYFVFVNISISQIFSTSPEIITLNLDNVPISDKVKSWSFKTGGLIDQIQLVDDRVISTGFDGYIYCHNIKSGQELWRAPINNHPKGRFQIINNLVSMSSDDGYQYLFNLADGSEQSRIPIENFNELLLLPQGYAFADNSKLLVKQSIMEVQNERQKTAPIISGRSYRLGDYVIFVAKSGQITAWSLFNHQKMWDFKANSPVSQPIIFENDHLYFTTSSGFLYAVDIQSGKESWRRGFKGRMLAPVSDGKDKLVVSSIRGMLFIVEKKTGKSLWQAELNSRPTAIAIDNTQVFVSLQNKELIQFDVNNGITLKKYHTSSIISDWIITDERLVIGMRNGNLCVSPSINKHELISYSEESDSCVALLKPEKDYAFHGQHLIQSLSLMWRSRTEGVLDPAVLIEPPNLYYGDDEYVYSKNLLSGKINWRYKISGEMGTKIIRYDNQLLFGARDSYLYSIDITTGTEQWRFHANKDIISTPAISDGLVYFGSQDYYLYAVNLKTGIEQWRFKSFNMINSSPVISNEKIIFGSGDHNIYALNKNNGALIWQFESSDWIVDKALITNNHSKSLVIFGNHEGYLYALNLNDGQLVWQFKTGGKIWYDKAQDETSVYFSSGDGYVYKLDKNTGLEEWRFNTLGAANYDTVLLNDTVFASSNSGKVYSLNKNTGKEIWSFSTRGEMRNLSIKDNYLAIGSTDFYLYLLKIGQ